jgi:hypothetical protein
MLKFNQSGLLTQRVVFFIFLLTTVSCQTLDPNFKIQENLTKSIEAYNDEFESKGMNSSARFVHPDHRSDYMQKSPEMSKRITFFEATTLDIKFFKDDLPAAKTPEGPEEGFNRTIVTIRYQIAVLPKTKLKTLIIEQEWVLFGEQWVVIPDFDAFLK